MKTRRDFLRTATSVSLAATGLASMSTLTQASSTANLAVLSKEAQVSSLPDPTHRFIKCLRFKWQRWGRNEYELVWTTAHDVRSFPDSEQLRSILKPWFPNNHQTLTNKVTSQRFNSQADLIVEQTIREVKTLFQQIECLIETVAIGYSEVDRSITQRTIKEYHLT